MKAKKCGARHPLLFYRRTMDRVWKATLILGLTLALAGGWPLIRETTILGLSSNVWLIVAAIASLALSVFAFLARLFAYVRVHQDYFSVVTPFLRLRISYRRMRSVHPALMRQIFPKNKSSWAERNYLEPLYGKTALVMELRGYPMDPMLLRLFFPPQMFSTQSKGFVFLVPDWMKLSTELDSYRGAWLQRVGRGRRVKGG